MKYQMSFVLDNHKHWAFFETKETALAVWRAMAGQSASQIECLENPNQA